VLEALPEIASRFDPKMVVSGAAGPDAGYFALAAIPARYAVERRDWQRAAELQPRETPFPYTDAITWFARGIAAARLHDAAKAQASVAALQDIRTRLEKAKESYWAGQAEIQGLEVNAWSSLAEGRKELALTMMKSAAEMEDGTDKKAITPGPLAPARELFGEMLLAIDQPTQALEQFEATLKKEPNRFRALYGAARAAQLSGNREASRTYFAELLKVCERADKPGRVEVLEANKAVLVN
jgi:tetratricopeptide (TPR) repeat protein